MTPEEVVELLDRIAAGQTTKRDAQWVAVYLAEWMRMTKGSQDVEQARKSKDIMDAIKVWAMSCH